MIRIFVSIALCPATNNWFEYCFTLFRLSVHCLPLGNVSTVHSQSCPAHRHVASFTELSSTSSCGFIHRAVQHIFIWLHSQSCPPHLHVGERKMVGYNTESLTNALKVIFGDDYTSCTLDILMKM